MLPPIFSPIGQYTEQEYDRARAYLVLAHAEIEAYCEERGAKVAQRAHNQFAQRGCRNVVLVGLLRFHHAQTRNPWTHLDKSAPRIDKAVNYYLCSIIGQNHGIREENLSKLLFPIGIDPADLDNVWLTTMDSFGLSRGAIAHTSVKTQQPIDPETEFLRVTTQIIPGLKKLDKKISRL